MHSISGHTLVPEAGPSKRKKITGRTNVTKACENCKRRKHKCDGVKPTCSTCVAFSDSCRWGPDGDGRSAPTQELVQALKNRVKELERMLGERGHQLPPPLEAMASESEDDDGIETVSQTMLHLQMGDDGGEEVHFHGPTSAYAHLTARIPQKRSPMGDNPVDPDEPHDYRRYLPSSVEISGEQHRIALDRFFRFFSSWGMRAVPNLFHRDLIRAVGAPPNTPPSRTAHYSPLLHNIILAIALIFVDEEHLRSPSVRAVFADEAQKHLDAELMKPTLATVHGLALKSSYHSTLGDHTAGWTYYGLADRAAQSLGLNVDCTSLVKNNGMSQTEMQLRNNAFWTVFIQDQCWSVYIGRPHSVQDYNTPLPVVDPALDKIQWTWTDPKMLPQDSYLSSTFVETAKLSVIMQKIMTTLYSLNSDVNKLLKDGTISKLNVALATWHDELPASLVIAPQASRIALPHILMLHLAYEWLIILLHRPYYRPVISLTGTRGEGAERQALSAMKRCDRSAAQINNLLRKYHERFDLRYTPPTLLNVAFTAGTTHLLTAVHQDHPRKKAEALQRAEDCVQLLRLVAVSWPAAGDKAAILQALVKEWIPPDETETKPLAKDEPLDDFFAQLDSIGSFDNFTLPIQIPQQRVASPEMDGWLQSLSPVHQQVWPSQSPPVPFHTIPNDQQVATDAWMRNAAQLTMTNPVMPQTMQPPQMSADQADFLRSLFTHISLPPAQAGPSLATNYPLPPQAMSNNQLFSSIYPQNGAYGQSPQTQHPWSFTQTSAEQQMQLPTLDNLATFRSYQATYIVPSTDGANQIQASNQNRVLHDSLAETLEQSQDNMCADYFGSR